MLTVEQIITQLNTDVILFFPRKELEQAILQQEAITPALLNIIEDVAKNPQSAHDTPAFIYALVRVLKVSHKVARALDLSLRYE